MLLKNNFLIVFIISIIYLLTVINAETFEECEGFEDTYVASSESCSSYIYCDGDDSIMDECEDGEYFDVDNQYCDAQENVFCPLDNVDGGEEEPEEPEEPEEVVTTPVVTTTTAPDVNVTTPMDILDIPPVIRDSCPSADDPNQIVLIANSNSCSDYYVCYHGHALEMHCMDHLHFNTLTGKCDFPENAHCKVGLIKNYTGKHLKYIAGAKNQL